MVITTAEENRARWLNENSRQFHVVIATRAALRTFPAAMAIHLDNEAGKNLATLTGRAIISSAVAGTVPTAELTMDLKNAALNAARSAAISAANSASTSASSAATSAVTSAAHSASLAAADSVDYSVETPVSWPSNYAFFSDCTKATRVNPSSCYTDFLWPNKIISEELVENSETMLETIPTSGSVWSFWRNWYEGFLNGRPLDWELQKRVALIPDDVWENGVEAVAEAISKIEKTYLFETTVAKDDPSHAGEESARYDGSLPKLILSRAKVVPPLVENPKTEKLSLPRNDDQKTDPLDFALTNVRHALDHALNECAENGFSDATEEASILNLALDNLPKEPRYIAGPFHHASCLFDRKFENTEYQSHGALTFLNNQLKAHVIAFVTEDPSIQTHIESYGSLPEPEPVSAETVQELRNAPSILEPVLEDDAKTVVGEITVIFEAGKPPSKYGWAVLVQWLAQVWTYLDKLKKHSTIATWIWKILEKLFGA